MLIVNKLLINISLVTSSSYYYPLKSEEQKHLQSIKYQNYTYKTLTIIFIIKSSFISYHFFTWHALKLKNEIYNRMLVKCTPENGLIVQTI